MSIVEGVLKELAYRSAWAAFTAEMREEERQDSGPVDAPDSDEDERPIPGTTLSPEREAELEQLDNLILPGMTEKGNDNGYGYHVTCERRYGGHTRC